MNYSDQQKDVIYSRDNLMVNAVAGSGKTSTLAGYAMERKNRPILYLAFNNSVKTEAIQKFQSYGLDNVRVETAHSLALSAFRNKQLKIYQGSYQPYDVKMILGFQQKDAVADMKFGRHVLQMVSSFCNSTVSRVTDLDYITLLKNPEDKAFVSNVYEQLIHESRRLLAKMKSGEIEMTHDFYLKMYQLSEPMLKQYDYLLFDEAQDASPVMLDVFMKQKGVKVMVGDEHQQIYSWRHAVNALKDSGFDRKYLSSSYRFHQDIADLAKAILSTKKHLEDQVHIPPIKGMVSKVGEIRTKATLGRTNGAILVDVIDQLIETEQIQKVYFEGHFQSYTYADEGGSVYDVLNLYQGDYRKIRNPMIKQFKDFQELQEYTDQSGDAPMKGIIDIVMRYGRELPHLINCIKESHVTMEQKGDADMVYSTVHKAKGMEYDQVKLLDDFLGEEKLMDLLERPDIDPDFGRLAEDINILYVATTRTKNKIQLPQNLIPADFEMENKRLIETTLPLVSNVESTAVLDVVLKDSVAPKAGKTYSYEEVRKSKPSAYSSWTLEDDLELEELFAKRTPIKELAEYFGRSRGAIASRIKKLELREKYFNP